MKKFEIIDHTADIGIKVYGKTLKELFINSAFGMFSLLADLDEIKKEIKNKITVHGVDNESLLVNWLNELVYRLSSKQMIYSGFDIKEMKNGKKYLLSAEICGQKINPGKQILPFEIKSATYSALKIKKIKKGYSATIIFDV